MGVAGECVRGRRGGGRLSLLENKGGGAEMGGLACRHCGFPGCSRGSRRRRWNERVVVHMRQPSTSIRAHSECPKTGYIIVRNTQTPFYSNTPAIQKTNSQIALDHTLYNTASTSIQSSQHPTPPTPRRKPLDIEKPHPMPSLTTPITACPSARSLSTSVQCCKT